MFRAVTEMYKFRHFLTKLWNKFVCEILEFSKNNVQVEDKKGLSKNNGHDIIKSSLLMSYVSI